jgi:hypothetical protein
MKMAEVLPYDMSQRLQEQEVIRKILEHLKLWEEPEAWPSAAK